MGFRLAAAAGVLVSAVVHLILWFDGMRDVSVVGPSFMLNAVGGVVIATLLLVWRHWIPPLLAAGFGASTLGAFITSTTVGLFGVHERWVGGYVWTAAIAEVVALVFGLLAFAQVNPLRSSGQTEHGSSVKGADLH